MHRMRVEARLEWLVRQGEVVSATREAVRTVPGVISVVPDKIDLELFKQWSLDVLSILKNVFGDISDHYQHAERAIEVVGE